MTKDRYEQRDEIAKLNLVIAGLKKSAALARTTYEDEIKRLTKGGG